MRFTISGLIVIGSMTSASVSLGDDASDSTFFETNVRPLLIAKCFECHVGEKPKAGLRLDSRETILAGGESGPAVVIGKPEESLLVDVIGYRNSVQMPPKAKLPERDIATLTEWVRRGLPWPDSKPSNPAPATTSQASVDFTDEQKSFWAFQPITSVIPPAVHIETWCRSPIDRFIACALESKGLSASSEADRRSLLRRVTIDLTGLLPSPQEVSDFVDDASPDALERVIDRLLASPRYGERWARHWLDVARYADSNGLDENLAYANAFRYRDYVVKAMREDKPYDQFLIEQIAGDLLQASDDRESPNGSARQESFDALIATGFLCLGAKMLAEDDPVKMQMDIIDEQVDTISRTVMGLTMGCARCHDHKFDPLTTEDYYGLAGIFKSTQTMDTFSVVARWHERPLATSSERARRDELQQVANAKKQAVEKLKSETTESILAEARKQSAAYLLAATRELQLADRLKTAKPVGSDPNHKSIAGVKLIEAEDYVRGNVLKDRETYGKGIGVLVNRGETPNFAEYEIDVKRAGDYQFELRYAAAATRPVKLFINSQLVKDDAASKVTGSWNRESQTWFVECFVSLAAGRNTIRLEQPQFFPHIDKLLLVPIDSGVFAGVDVIRTDLPDASGKQPRLIGSLTRQWAKAVEESRSNPKSILTAWNQFVSAKRLTIDPAVPENGVTQLLGEKQPASLADLAVRYERMFAQAQQAWTEIKSSDVGKSANSLPDPMLEAARRLITDPKGPWATPADIETSFPSDVADRLKLEREEIARHEAAIPKFLEAMAVEDSKPENLRIHLRGSHLTLGREVPRQLPKILAGKKAREVMDGSGRLALARWLASSDHPLTARVMANRLWQWHFGQGLVRSPDNFGRLGERPSHPELLNWLAREFSGPAETTDRSPRSWSLKSIHRLVMSSATYRQGTGFNATAALADPENRLLWRFHRQRMSVEVLRDSLLQLSDRLDETPGGTLLPTANRNYVTSTASVNPTTFNGYRRAIYLPVVRSALYQVFTAFDFADPSTPAGQRDETTVAPQALFMMNSDFVLEQSRGLASRLLEQKETSSAVRIRQLCNLAYCRDPSEAEVSRAVGYLDRVRAAMMQSEIPGPEIELRAWTSLCRAILSANEFLYVD